MELFLLKNKVYFEDSGICGRLESVSSSFSITDWMSLISSLEIATIAMLVIIKRVATIAVALVIKLPADLENIKLS